MTDKYGRMRALVLEHPQRCERAVHLLAFILDNTGEATGEERQVRPRGNAICC
jgi:hypothetical protein